jgi:SAM-dependent methyltransferase
MTDDKSVATVTSSQSFGLYAKARERLKWLVFAARLRVERPLNRAFDKRYGVETSEELPLVDAGVAQADAARGNSVYRCVWGSVFHRALKAAAIDHRRFTFVDFGAGKGKALFLAAVYPFARIVGVEYAPGLHEAAQRNIATYRNPARECSQIESILGDAREFPLPSGPLFCHFFNPFDDPTMHAVLARLAAHGARTGADIYVAFLNMRDVKENAGAFDKAGAFETIRAARQFRILRLRARV